MRTLEIRTSAWTFFCLAFLATQTAGPRASDAHYFDNGVAPLALQEECPSTPVPFPSFHSPWSGRIGTIVLDRTNLDNSPLIISSGGDALVSANNFNFRPRGGLDASIWRRGKAFDIEARYFGIDHWNADIGPTLLPAGVAATYQNNDGAPFPVDVEMRMTSALYSGEVNITKPIHPAISLLAGFRYLRFKEAYRLDADVGPGFLTSTMRQASTNSLYGGQVGANLLLWALSQRLQFESALKAGIYGNDSSNRFDVMNPAADFNLSRSGNSLSFAGELSTTASYQFNSQWSGRVGYQMLWLDGLVLATDQPPNIDLVNATWGKLTDNGRAFFHGVTLGVAYLW